MMAARSNELQRVPLEQIITDAQSGFASGERDSGGVIQLRMNNVTTDGGLDWSSALRVPATKKQVENYQLQRGDVLFNSTNSPSLVGKTTVFDGYEEPVVFSNHFVRIRVDEAQVNSRYLARWFNHQWNHRVFEKLCTQWVNQAAVRKDDLLALEVVLPPLPEQQRIAAILDKADRLRRLRRYALDLGETYLQSVFLEMFGDPVRNPKGWDFCELQELIRDGDTINYGVVQPGDDVPNGIPIVRVGDFDDLPYTSENLKRIAPEIEASYKRSRLVGDEVLIACVGSIGKIALVHEGLKGFNIVRAVARVPFSDSVNRLYLATYLSTKYVQDYFQQETRTVSQPTLNILQIQETPTMLPPLALQEKFAGIVRQYDRLRAQQRESLRQAEMLFGALLEGSFHPHP